MPNRRHFLQATASTVFMGTVAPGILGAENKSGTKSPILGEGDFQFIVNHDWARLPQHLTWTNTHGVAIDRSGFVYITHQGDPKRPCDTVVVFDPEGTYVRSFGIEYAGGGHGIDIRKENGEEFIYLCDIQERQIIKCDLQGEWVWKRRYPREPGTYREVKEFRPTNVCFGTQGELYVADGYGAHLIHQYNAAGNWLRSWGGNGAQAGKFKTPHGLWLDQRPGREAQIVVADRANARLQYFSVTGVPQQIEQGVSDPLLSGKTSVLTDDAGNEVPVRYSAGLSFPADIDCWEELMIIADLHARVLLYDAQNEIIARLGEEAAWTNHILKEPQIRQQPDKWIPGKFIHPHDACFDLDGNIIVTEWVEQGRVTMLTWL